ncbi:MAG: ATP-binding protein [Treponema sp.]|nr:ATP-binding protein [Treponema sp.]MCL2272968.1 ATP-binding protein [Treponema sp.]
MRKAAVLIFLVTLFSCGNPAEREEDTLIKFEKFTSYRDVPGITAEEIREIDLLKWKYDYFIYGMPLSVEAFKSLNGEIRGFSALLCEWMTQLFGIPFQPQIYDWLDLLDGLETEEVSFTGELTANKERMEIYHMTTDIASRPLRYFRLSGSRPINEIIRERRLKCGFIEGTTTRYTVTAELTSGTYEVIELSDVSLVYDALRSGYIDSFYYSGTVEINFIEHPDVIAYDFYPLIYRPVSLTTQDDALKPIITVMEKILENGGLRYLTDMYNRGIHEYLVHKLHSQLTPEERLFIKHNAVIPIGVDPENYPDTFYDSRKNEWGGIFLDILDEVSFLTGIQFKRVNNEHADWSEIYRMLMNGEIALIPYLIQTEEREGAFLWPEIAQVDDNYALISNSDFRDIKVNEILYVKTGLMKNTAYTATFKKWFPNHMNIVEYDTMDEAFKALQHGEVDMVMTTHKKLLYLTNYLEQPYFKANIVFGYSANSKFGFNKDQEILCSIFNKALASVDMKGISDKWMRKTYDYKLKLAEAQRPLLVGLSALLFCVLALVAVLFTRSHLMSMRLEKLVAARTRDLQVQTTTLNTLFDSIPDVIFTLDSNLKFSQCNKKFLEHFGLNRENVIGRNERSLNFPDDMTEERIAMNQRVLDERRIFVFEEHIPGIDGSSPLFETIKSPLLLDGVNVGVLGIARDITKRKEMEEAALAASRIKSSFLANMSHEIRTPMNSIMGFSELAMDSAANPKTKEYLGKIRSNAEWLLQIINDVLDISKVESGKMELEKIPFDIHELFSSCRTLVLPKAVEKGINLHFYAEPSLGKMPLGDPTRLRQVFINFLTNAVKFTNSGIVKLFSKIIASTDNTITMHFEIKDSGIGMTSEQVEKIFDPFTQAESGTTRKYGGTGLGLAITKNIIELMGGRIHIDSAPGIGSRFSFDLVFDTVDESSDKTQRKTIDHGDIERPFFSGEILLCEDNLMNQEVITEHLARVGIKTIIAENGKVGVEMVRERMEKGEKQFDLIFMDIHMPVMDGLEASAKIIQFNTGIPIVAMTANIMSTDTEIYRKSGMQDFIGKPFTSQELWRCLLKYFSLSQKSGKQDLTVEADKDFNKSIRMLFVKQNRNICEEIAGALKANDIKIAHRLAHTLKSNAAQIGKTLLQQAAANIEARLKNGENDVTEENLKILEAEMNAVLNELLPQYNEYIAASVKGEAPPFSPEKIRETFEKLEPLLKNGNSECLKYMDDLRSVPGSEDLIRHMEDFELGKAMTDLELMKISYLG